MVMRSRRCLSALLVILVTTSCGGELAVQGVEPPTPTPAPTRLPYDPDDLRIVERRDLLDAITGRGTVEPKLTEELFFRRDGRISSIEVASGDQVEQGQVLARLEQADLVYQIGLAEIDVELAELRDREAGDRDASSVELAIAAKEVERARLALERLETERAALEVTAPYAGRISELGAKVGAEVAAFQPVMTIVGTEELIIYAEFTGPKSGRLDIGQEVMLEDFFNKELAFTGTISGRAQGSSSKFVVEPETNAPELKLGDSLKATVVLGRVPNVLVLPVEVVKSIGERRYVLLVSNGELRRVFVETGIETDGVVELTSGIEEGQAISAR